MVRPLISREVLVLATFLSIAVPVVAQDESSFSDSSSSSSSSSSEDSRDRVYYPGDTERAKPLARKLATNILLDQKEIWTSPFHMSRGDAKWWLGFGAVTGALIATDHDSATILHNGSDQVSWGNNLSKVGTAYTLLPVVAGFYGFGVFKDDPKAREVGVLGAEAIVDSLIVVSVLKPIAGRERPNSSGEKGHFFDGGASFPSGHAAASWALASVISYEYGHTKVVPIVACALAGLVSAARFTAQQHYASDIIAGGGIGWFVGRYVWKTHQDHAIHHHGWLTPRVMPEVQPGAGTYAVALAWSK